MEQAMAAHMPPGYGQAADPDAVAGVVLAASTWSVPALTCHIAPHEDICPVFKGVFRFHLIGLVAAVKGILQAQSKAAPRSRATRKLEQPQCHGR
ncbi:MAG: hypothetical protein JSR15_10095 [Proteobacteria bacterium]|nr:hypothetical protein [Pseudomonadota bacterium]